MLNKTVFDKNLSNKLNKKWSSRRLLDRRLGYLMLIGSMVLMPACQQQQANELKSTETTEETSSTTETVPLTIKHELGETIIEKIPEKVAVLSMNEVDFLDQLDVPIAGMVKDFIPNFLAKYKGDDSIDDLGAIVQPNMERVYALHPDLILITPLQAQNYDELTQIAPTLHFDIDYQNSGHGHIDTIKQHLLTLGKIFNKQALAKQKVADIDKKLAEVNELTRNKEERALVILHNNGTFSNFGTQSRYGFVFSDLGVKPASSADATSLHGETISSEFIAQTDPDILYIVDRTAVMQQQETINADNVSNPLLKSTKAWKNGNVVFVNADAWYTTSASPTSIQIIMDDVIKGYQ